MHLQRSMAVCSQQLRSPVSRSPHKYMMGWDGVNPFADLHDEENGDSEDFEETDDGSLVRQLDPEMSASDYVHCDDNIATSSTFENKINWREE